VANVTFVSNKPIRFPRSLCVTIAASRFGRFQEKRTRINTLPLFKKFDPLGRTGIFVF